MTLHARILEVSRNPIDSRWDEADVYSVFWRIYVNAQRGASLALADGVYEITPNRMHVIPAWLKFSCHCETGRVIDHRYIHFAVEGLPGVVSRRIFDRPFAIPSGPLPWSAWAGDEPPDVGEAVREVAGKAWGNTALARAFERLEPTERGACRPFVTGAHRFAAVLDAIERRLDQPLCNAELAAAAHLSEGQFIRRFKREIGQTPAQYIRERRVTAAAQRLRAGDEPIDQIAEACGFGDRHYLTRTFTRIMGAPPAGYRQRNRV